MHVIEQNGEALQRQLPYEIRPTPSMGQYRIQHVMMMTFHDSPSS